jgi:2C-methyl-D-erythritol 2,4-cyclodiphosphate synthase
VKEKVIGRVLLNHDNDDYVKGLESKTVLEDKIAQFKKQGYKLKDIKYRTINDGETIEFYIME